MDPIRRLAPAHYVVVGVAEVVSSLYFRLLDLFANHDEHHHEQ